jgi:hypothetical protein
MDAQTTLNLTRIPSVHTCLTVMLTLLLTHSLALTIMVGLYAARHTTHLPQRVLAWRLLSLGWVGTIKLADWGLCWLFTRFILLFIYPLICSPPRHNDIALESFGGLPQSLRSSQPSIPLQIPMSLQDALHLQNEDEPPLTPPYHHTHNLTTPAPIYDPTALACYQIEGSWAQKPGLRATTDAEIEPIMQNSMQLVQWQEEGQGR